MYIEASDQQEGDKARISTFPMTVSRHGVCNMKFYYYMHGTFEGELNIYTKLSESEKQLFHLKGDQGLGWKQANVDISYSSVSGETFTIIFEGKNKNAYIICVNKIGICW